jgi:hypothetical protein
VRSPRPPGQACRLALDDGDARADVEARLRAGAGRLARGELSLQLAWDVKGTVRTRLALPGGDGAWTPPVPLRGVVEGAGRGREERVR